MFTSVQMVESHSSSEHSDKRTTNPADTPVQPISVPRWAVIVAALVLLLPVLTISSMMLMIGLFGPPMHGGMATAGLGLFPIVGVIPLVLKFAVIYGVYRLYTADTH